MLIFPMLLQIIAGTFCCGFRRNYIHFNAFGQFSKLMLHILFVYIGEIFASFSDKVFIIIAMPAMIDAEFFDCLHIAMYGYIGMASP